MYILQRRYRFAAVVVVSASILLGGCGGETAAIATPQPAAPPQPEAPPMHAELLYQLLVANLALRGGEKPNYATAQTALAAAAKLADDPRLLAQAIAVAANLADHPRVINLSKRLLHSTPAQFHQHYALAAAYFATAKRELGLAAAVDYVRAQPLTRQRLQTIVNLLAKQRPPILPQLRARLKTATATPELQLVAAQVARAADAAHDFNMFMHAALKLRPDWQLAAMLRLEFLADNDRESIPQFANQFLRSNPRADEFRLQYAWQLFDQQRSALALTQFEILRSNDSAAAELWFGIGLAHMQRYAWAAAETNLQQALALQPDDPRISLTLADVHLHAQKFAAADALLAAITDSRYYFDAQLRRATVFAYQKSLAAAMQHLAKLNPGDAARQVQIILQQEWLYRQFKNYAQAKKVLDAGLQRMPKQPQLLYRRGLWAAEQNLVAAAEQDMRAVIALQPNNASAYNALGYTFADQNVHLDAAMELLTTAQLLQPYDAAILDSVGWLHFRRGEYTTAINYLRRALAGQQNAEIAAHLGEAYWAVGKRRAARKVWRRAWRWDRHHKVLRETLQRLSPRDAAREAW